MGKPITTNSELFREIEKLYLEEDLTSSQITARLGGRASIYTVHRYITEIIRRRTEQGLSTPTQRRKPSGGAAASTAKVLSQTHHNVGLHILRHRMGGEDNLQPKDYAIKHGLGNQQSIPKMEHGKYDFTLSELLRIAEIGQEHAKDVAADPPEDVGFAE